MEKAPGLPPCERGVQARSLFCVYGKRAQTLQRAGRGGGDGRHHKAQADDPQSNFSGFHRLRGRGKEPHERLRGCQTAKGARCHDGGAQDEGDLVELAYPFVLPGTVVVADEGTHSLHDAVGGKVEECL